jgi:hypothetical protein
MTVGRAPKHEDLFRSTRELCYCGMSDREAVDASVFDARWKYAAGRKRVLDSTALYDAVATQDRTVTCPSGRLVELRLQKDGSGVAEFGENCAACPLRA